MQKVSPCVDLRIKPGAVSKGRERQGVLVGSCSAAILVPQSFPDFPSSAEDASQKEPRITEADLVFHHVLQEQGAGVSPPEQHFSTEVRLTVNSRRRSLERIVKPGRCLWSGSSCILGQSSCRIWNKIKMSLIFLITSKPLKGCSVKTKYPCTNVIFFFFGERIR